MFTLSGLVSLVITLFLAALLLWLLFAAIGMLWKPVDGRVQQIVGGIVLVLILIAFLGGGLPIYVRIGA